MANESRPQRVDSKPAPVAGIMDRLVASLGLSRQYYGWQMVTRWSEIVGEHNARNSKAIRFDDGVLYVAVEDPAQRQEIAMLADEILKTIHRYPHGRVVKNLRLVRGEKGTRANAE